MTNQEIAPFVSALVALVAVIIGPWITLRVAKKQIEATGSIAERQIETSKAVADLHARANVLSKNRQDWINALRIEIAGFMTSVSVVLPLLFSQKDSIEMYKLLSQMQLHLSRTRLLINPKESDHAVLVEKMNEMAQRVLSFDNKISDLNDELVRLAQTLLKREWERVKSFT